MNTFTFIFLTFLILGTGLRFWLAQRQLAYIRLHQNAVPKAFAAKISLAEHQHAATYTSVTTRFAQRMLLVETVILLFWTLGGGLEWLDQSWRSLAWPELWTGVAVLISFGILSTIIELPSSFYSTFKIEAQFGFNKTTLGLFITDLLKSMILTLIIGIPLLTLILWLMAHAGNWWWLSVWIVWISFSLFMMWAYPTWIAPLFNKFRTLEDDELKQRIESLLQRNGFSSQGVFVMDGSKRSGHGNAYFTGFGKQKRIVFFDTLLESLNADEVEAVLAHEIGHYKLNHLLKQIVLMATLSLIGLAGLGWLMEQNWFYHGLGVSTPSTYLALLLFIMILPVFTFILHPTLAWFSRRHEFEADNFAVKQTNAQPLIQALVKLYKDNASTLTPDPLYSAFYDSHPPAPVRVAHLSDG
jgi:STE24 endopeptidase